MYWNDLVRSGTMALFSNKNKMLLAEICWSKLLADLLKDRKKIVVLNGQVLNCADIIAGVCEGSSLGYSLFWVTSVI